MYDICKDLVFAAVILLAAAVVVVLLVPEEPEPLVKLRLCTRPACMICHRARVELRGSD